MSARKGIFLKLNTISIKYLTTPRNQTHQRSHNTIHTHITNYVRLFTEHLAATVTDRNEANDEITIQKKSEWLFLFNSNTNTCKAYDPLCFAKPWW